MSRRSRKSVHSKHDNNVFELRSLALNHQAIAEGPQKKHWTSHDLRTVRPLTPAQEEMFHDFFAGKNICAHGSAGTGKTYVALWLACNELVRKDSDIRRIIIVRSAVPGRDVGFVPGTLEEKVALYEVPYRDMFHDFFGRWSSYEDMKEAHLVEFTTTSFIRGVTWDDAIVVVDEGQNMTFHEINTIMTRIGENSRIIFTGDLPQTDLRKTKFDCSGMADFVTVASQMSSFSTVKFTYHDIVRSAFVKEWIIASEQVTF